MNDKKAKITEQEIKLWILDRISTDLGIAANKLNPDMALMSLGLSSRLAISMVQDLAAWLEIALKPVVLFKYPTINKMAKYLSGLEPNQALPTENVSPSQDILLKDIEVKEVNIFKDAPITNAEQQNFLLTGASGFLGCNLLQQLLQHTSGQVYCLIHADNTSDAQSKLAKACAANNIVLTAYADRIKYLAGDLLQPQLGLPAAVWDELSNNVTTIIHNGAKVNHVYDYMQLRGENVLVLDEIIKLANSKRNKSIHFISSVAVLYLYSNNAASNTTQWYDTLASNLSNGYAISKMCAELKLHNALRNGFNVNVFRLSQLFGNSATGNIEPSRDEILNFIKGCIQLGVYPQIDIPINVLPVDHAAKAIVTIVQHAQKPGQVYNIINYNKVAFSDLFKWLVADGYNLQSVTLEQFVTEYVPRIDSKNSFNVFKSNIGAKDFFGYDLNAFKIQVDTSNAQDVLAENENLLQFNREHFMHTVQFIRDWLNGA